MTKVISPYGSWLSPITPQLVTQTTPTLSEPQYDGDTLYWLESRPNEKGRNAIVTLGDNGVCRDVLPHPLNARTRVNEYGGGSYCVRHGVIYFVLYSDQRIYRLSASDLSAFPEAITKESLQRFADIQFDPRHNQLITVCEDHNPTLNEPSLSIISISLSTASLGEITTLVCGDDFYSTPRLSPDGTTLAWISWNHPNMPWDTTRCCTGHLSADNLLTDINAVASATESLCQPRWSPNGELYLISDRNNWWNIYRVNHNSLEPVVEMDAEFAYPPWVFALSNYDFLNDASLLASYTQNGLWYLAEIDLSSGKINTVNCPYTDISYVTACNSGAVFVGASSTLANSLIGYQTKHFKPLVQTASPVSLENLSAPQPITFTVTKSEALKPATEMSIGWRAATPPIESYGFFYPPTSFGNDGLSGEKPPLIVFCHGGPTAAAQSALNLKIQFWTSRGFAVADVNYGGSTGYGRQYRNRLRKSWGLVDVADVVACVDYLADKQLIDSDRVAIRGSSAGGYTVLAALTFSNRFKAGASLYGIGDLETLARDTHKFESRYLDTLVGAYPDEMQLYQARSPIHHVEHLSCPVIFLQGLKDTVVPPDQAEAMVSALDNKNIPVAYVTFEDEAHGFRQADNIHRALEAELYFYSKVFDINLPEKIRPVTIRHADKLLSSR